MEKSRFLNAFRGNVETFIAKLERWRAISFFAFRNIERIEDKPGKLRIDSNLPDRLNSEDTKSVVNTVNTKPGELAEKVGDLKGKINKHETLIAKTVAENQDIINGFLKSAGDKTINYSLIVIKP